MIENNLVVRNSQLLKDCLLLCPGSTHDYSTFTTLVLFDCYSLPAGPSDECAHSRTSASWKLSGYKMGRVMGEGMKDKRVKHDVAWGTNERRVATCAGTNAGVRS